MAWPIPVADERANVGAAMYLCLLGYPDSEAHRSNAFKAALSYQLRLWRKRNKEAERAVRGDPNGPMFTRSQALLDGCAERDMWGSLGRLHKQLLNRLRAAESFAYFGVVAFVKPSRNKRIGNYRVSDWPADPPHLVARKKDGLPVMELVERLHQSRYTDLVRIGAERWNTSPGNVRKNILNPSAPVLHLAIALREVFLSRRAAALSRRDDPMTLGDFLLQLLGCPQWTLGALEDAQIIAETWSAKSSANPSWKSIDPGKFIELRPDFGAKLCISGT